MIRTTLALAAFLATTAIAIAAPEIGKPAPAFTAVDSNGKSHALADFKGKTVILEWTNDGCPYVKKHYNAGNMQKIQKDLTADGAVWLSVISSAPGKQGHVDGKGANDLTKSRNAAPTAVLLDPKGTIGRAYEAQTTPHMYVIDGKGVLRYMGAIDDKPSTDAATIAGARNYVREAVAAVKAGKPVEVAATDPYGCSVKYP
ncbi:MAG: redoxin domain-containing protein [Alphaproteobacteria bacterium]|nr:redoxin domain-containing protein [Alphaproteobacteria bacterium]